MDEDDRNPICGRRQYLQGSFRLGSLVAIGFLNISFSGAKRLVRTLFLWSYESQRRRVICVSLTPGKEWHVAHPSRNLCQEIPLGLGALGPTSPQQFCSTVVSAYKKNQRVPAWTLKVRD